MNNHPNAWFKLGSYIVLERSYFYSRGNIPATGGTFNHSLLIGAKLSVPNRYNSCKPGKKFLVDRVLIWRRWFLGHIELKLLLSPKKTIGN